MGAGGARGELLQPNNWFLAIHPNIGATPLTGASPKTVNDSAALMLWVPINQDQPAKLNQRGDKHRKAEQKAHAVCEGGHKIDMKQYVGGGAHAREGV